MDRLCVSECAEEISSDDSIARVVACERRHVDGRSTDKARSVVSGVHERMWMGGPRC